MLQLNASCRDVVAQFQALFVLTGQRSVLKYLAKPIFKAFGGAMNER